MARAKDRRRVVEVIEAPSASSAVVEKILTSLKPDREITASEFLKRAFQFPQIDKISVQKFSAGTWNFAESLGNLGGEIDPNTIEQYLSEKYGKWRFRLLAVCQGEVITQHLINLDGWQESEARAAASSGATPGRPVIGPSAKAVGPGATAELLAAARERIEIDSTTALLRGLSNPGAPSANGQMDVMLGPMKAMMEMMTLVMTSFKDVVQNRNPSVHDDPFMAYLREEVKFLREQATKPAASRDPDALSKTIDTIDGLLQKTLHTSLAEMLTGVEKTEASGWSATIQGIIEGVRPYLPDILSAVQSTAATRPALPRGPATVIPITRPSPHMPQPTGDAVPPSPSEGGDQPMPVNPAFAEVIELFIGALKEHDFETLDTLLTNPPLLGQVNINPKAKAKVYVVALSGVDPRFRSLESEIEAYLKHMRDEIAKAEAEDQQQP